MEVSQKSREHAQQVVDLSTDKGWTHGELVLAIAQALDRAFVEGCEYERLLIRMEQIKRTTYTPLG